MDRYFTDWFPYIADREYEDSRQEPQDDYGYDDDNESSAYRDDDWYFRGMDEDELMGK